MTLDVTNEDINLDDLLLDTNHLMDILCDGVALEQFNHKEQEPPIALSERTTVMGLQNTPVVVEDPVRFRQDLQACVRMQMLKGMPTETEIIDLIANGSMIEIALVKQLMSACNGDLDAFKYLMDRVLGKPVNQTNTISATISYEDMLNQLNPDEVIEPKKVYCDDVSSY